MSQTSSVSRRETSRTVEEHDGHLVSISCGWTTACAASSNSTKCFLWDMKHESNTDEIHQPDLDASIESTSNIASVATNDTTVFAVTADRHLLSASVAEATRSKCVDSTKSTLIFFRPMLPDLCVKSVSCGKHHVLVLSAIGVVFSQGIGAQGQLGQGSIEPRPSPTVVEALEGVSVVAIAAGGWHSMAVTDAGDLYVWGWNEQGQLGLPSENVSGKKNKCGEDGVVFLPGERRRKRCSSTSEDGDGSNDDRASSEFFNVLTLPHVVDVLDASSDDETPVVKVAAGSRHSVCLLADGTTLTWGWNGYGQLGLGDAISRDAPCLVTSFDKDSKCRVVDVFAGWWNSVFVTGLGP